MGKTVGCGCDYCMSRGVRRDFRHDFSDGYDEVDYTLRKRKGNKVCKKNKGGPHVPGTFETTGHGSWLYEVLRCQKCSKHLKYKFDW